MDNILTEAKPSTIKLADGKEYILPPITLNVLANLEDEFGCGIDKLQEQLTNKSATSLRKFLKVLLQENYPDMTLDKVCKLVTMDGLSDVMDEIAKIITR